MATTTTLTALNAISPLDGRYWVQLHGLSHHFSEFSLIRYRVWIEVEYFIALCKLPLPHLSTFGDTLEKEAAFHQLRGIYTAFEEKDALRVKEIEKTTNHDMKAIEYFIKERFDQLGFERYKEFIHFALTSQDINNTAIPLSLKHAVENAYLPSLKDHVLLPLQNLAETWKAIPILARTHGQPATPTTLGKEIMVFVERLTHQISMISTIPYACKFGGATGGLNAHHVAYPNIDWIHFADIFAGTLGLKRMKFTTQIEHYDYLAALCDNLKRINTILIDLSRDFWTYISLEYFHQRLVKNEVGSSAMPHKVNPIDFENAEGNLGLANAIFEHLSSKLPISRMQRDLTDSTVLRNLGVPFAHSILSFKSLGKGLGKLLLNQSKINKDLEENWAVVSEAIQTILRRENYPNPYEALKEFSRTGGEGEKITMETMSKFVDSLNIDEKVKHELRSITPYNYTGVHPNFDDI